MPPHALEIEHKDEPAAVAYEVKPEPAVSKEANDDGKAPSLNIFNFFDLRQVQIRNMHLSWFSFFIAFTAWFSVAPLNPIIKKAFKLTKDQINYGNLAALSSTVFARVLMGPLCDRFGPKTAMSILLILGSIPVACMTAVHSWEGLVTTRAFMGLLGSSFVMCQAWTTGMFQKRVAGTANGIVGGWGNLGGAFTQVFMVWIFSYLVPDDIEAKELKKPIFAKAAWDAGRYAFLVPAAILFVTGIFIYFAGQDTPKGDIRDLRKKGVAISAPAKSLTAALREPATYVLMLHYAASFGVELVVFNQAATYFHEEFKVGLVRAGEAAALGGVTNIFARAAGGILSDFWNSRYGMKARLGVQFTLLFFEGALLLWFSNAATYKSGCILLLAFSVFVQAANGSCFAIVPYVNEFPGSVSGMVGAGGNIGGVIFTLMFIFAGLNRTADGFRIMGYTVLCIACTTFFIKTEGVDEPKKALKPAPIDATIHMEDEEV